MSDQAAPEPTMEEILASIRRIISEDDTATEEAEAEAPEPAPAPVVAAAPPAAKPAPVIEADDDGDDELELTQRVEAPPKETVGDIEAYAPKNEPPPRAAAPEPRPMPKPQPAPVRDTGGRDDAEGLVSSPSAFAAASAFGQLSAAISMPAQGRTLEDLVTELMKPLLRDWLDQNLAAIVEAKVADEVERIARGRVR
jgi:cell pole-organizing protein PopZ